MIPKSTAPIESRLADCPRSESTVIANRSRKRDHQRHDPRTGQVAQEHE